MQKKLLFLVFALVFTVMIIVNFNKGNKNIENEKKLKIATSIFPVYDIAKTIVGEKGEVFMIIPPGVEGHDFEPTPNDIIKLKQADIVFYVDKNMELWISKLFENISNETLVINASNGIDLIKGVYEHGDKENNGNINEESHQHKVDPHIWLDPINMKKMTDNFLEAILKKDEKNKNYYIKNAEEYKNKLDLLDENISKTLKKCKLNKIYYGGHYAFGYFSKRYGIEYKTPYKNFSPNSEPTPNDIKEIIKEIKSNNIKYIFTEELLVPKVSELISKETGVQILVLHGAHNITKEEIEKGITYFDIMMQNIENLKKGLDYNE